MAGPRSGARRLHELLNGRHHTAALAGFLLIVLAHWAEHAAQAVQIWVFDRDVAQARGVLGEFYPWLVSSEWMHYLYALVTLAGLLVLRVGFPTGAPRAWWTAAAAVGVWHHLEHLLLLGQRLTGEHLAGRPVPTSVVQLVAPRFELHLTYNTAVTIPLAVAIGCHLRVMAARARAGALPAEATE